MKNKNKINYNPSSELQHYSCRNTSKESPINRTKRTNNYLFHALGGGDVHSGKTVE